MARNLFGIRDIGRYVLKMTGAVFILTGIHDPFQNTQAHTQAQTLTLSTVAPAPTIGPMTPAATSTPAASPAGESSMSPSTSSWSRS